MVTVNITSELVSVAFLIIITCGILVRKKELNTTATLFLASMIATIFGTIFDALSYLLDGNPQITGLLFLLNILAIGGCDIIMTPFIYYAWSLVNEKKTTPIIYAHVVVGVCFADLVFIIVGSFTGSVFTMENGWFTEGPLFDYMGFAQIVMMIYFFIFITSKMKIIGRKAVLAIGTYFVLPTTAAVVDLLIPNASMVYVAVSLVMVIVYISLQSEEIEKGRIREKVMLEVSNTDVLTKLNNRRAFEARLGVLNGMETVGAVFCDVNGLKFTNDNFGHAAGDELLIRFTALLKTIYETDDIFRISGDEFVILTGSTGKNKFEERALLLRQQTKKNDDIAAVGTAFGKGEDILKLISEAEKAMYGDKHDYYMTKGIDRRK